MQMLPDVAQQQANSLTAVTSQWHRNLRNSEYGWSDKIKGVFTQMSFRPAPSNSGHECNLFHLTYYNYSPLICPQQIFAKRRIKNTWIYTMFILSGSLSLCLFFSQHTSLSASRSEKGTGWSSRSLGARCRNSIALCSDEQPHIGNYRLLKTIGKGNFAKVKLARHILTGREVSNR